MAPPREVTPVITLTGDALASDGDRSDIQRIVTYLMLFRVGVATALLLAMVVLVLVSESPGNLAGPFGRFVSALLATTYLATLGYAVVLRRIRDPVLFAYIQIGIDLTLITLLVHATGGAQSAYTFLYLIDVVAAALLPKRFGVALVAVAAGVLILFISLAGYLHILPPIPGQSVFPWDLTRQELLFRQVVLFAGLVSVAALGMNLSTHTRQVGERLARHQRIAGDLASLHWNTIRCLSSGLVTVDLRGAVTSINEAACEILGLTEPEAMGQSLHRRIPGFGRVLEEVGLVGSVKRQEVDAVRLDGSIRRLGLSATPLSDHEGKIIGRVIHFQDLTELRRMEMAVQRAERLASIGRLAASLAHEIRNPLASISGSVELLKGVPGADTETRQLADIAVREVERLDRLISSLLAYARPRTEERQPLDLGEVAAEVAKAFEQERRENELRVIVEAQANVVIEGASSQIRQVLWNLVRNADDAMPSGGTIHIRVMLDDSNAMGVVEAVLSITDVGVGIPREEIDHVFEPFFSTKRSGTGLGLPTVARIIEDHKGTVDITSEPGRGTTFTLRFPRAVIT